MCWNTYFILFFEHHPKLDPKRAKKNDNFWHFAKHRFIKKTFVATPLLTKQLCFLKLFVLKPKTIMLNKNITQNQGDNKDKKKGFERKSKTGNQKKRKDWRKQIAIEYFDVVLFVKQKQRRNNRKKRQKQGSKRKQKRKTRRKKERKEEERDREREIEKGGSKKRLRRNKGGDSKITKKCPFLGGKQVFFFYWKPRKERPKKNYKTKKQK